MKKNVRITVRGEQHYADGERDAVEFTAEGTLTTADWGCQLDYDESALTGMEGTHTVFRVRSGSVSLLRTGTFRARMRFEPGKKHTAPYETPCGSFSMSVLAHTLRGGLTERGGTLEIGYTVELEHIVSGDNRFLLTVCPMEEPDEGDT